MISDWLPCGLCGEPCMENCPVAGCDAMVCARCGNMPGHLETDHHWSQERAVTWRVTPAEDMVHPCPGCLGWHWTRCPVCGVKLCRVCNDVQQHILARHAYNPPPPTKEEDPHA